MRFIALLFLALLAPSLAFAAEMKFGWPVACMPGQTCWIVNYVDDDPLKTSAKDFECGDMTYEGHDGTDIAIKDHKSIENNIPVLAAADGTVLRTRNSVEDRKGTASDLQASSEAKNECGNAVIIAHENGWKTLYCHMKKGSVSVKAGQHVRTGDRLGSVGQSGLAEFAHLHFGVMHNNQIIDPFTGMSPKAGCGLKNAVSLWSTPITYESLIPYAAGFSDQLPVLDQLVNDTTSPSHISAKAPILIFWILLYGTEPGDHIEMKILDPDGTVYVQKDSLQEKKEIRVMKYIGLRTKNKPLNSGTYTGNATLLRTLSDGRVLRHTAESSVVIESMN